MGKMRDGAQWLSNHYAANDYYCEGEKVVGTWVGKGAEIFGIEGRSIEPQDEAFLAIFSGKTPSGEKLKQRDSDIIGYDFQCSVQKSVSIMAILGGALLPPLQGAIADHYGIQTSFIVPMLAFAYIAFYGIHGYKAGRPARATLAEY